MLWQLNGGLNQTDNGQVIEAHRTDTPHPGWVCVTLHFLRNVKCRLSKDHVAPLILGRRLHHGTISCMYTRGLKGSLKTVVVLNRLAECYLIVPKCSRLVAEDKTLQD